MTLKRFLVSMGIVYIAIVSFLACTTPEDANTHETTETVVTEPEVVWETGTILATYSDMADWDSWSASVEDTNGNRIYIEAYEEERKFSVMYLPGDRIRFNRGDDNYVAWDEIELLEPLTEETP